MIMLRDVALHIMKGHLTTVNIKGLTLFQLTHTSKLKISPTLCDLDNT